LPREPEPLVKQVQRVWQNSNQTAAAH
jgi:hypothetical protein